ncbi:MAG: YwaF family protein [Clostridia bacterium]|nr:YwaF family protein [Clostridia bacterium]
MFYSIFFCVLVALVCFCLALEKKKGPGFLDGVIKTAAVAFIVFSMAGLLLPDLFACSHELPTLETMIGTEFHAMIRWMNAVCFTVLPIAAFQKNHYFEKIASFFCLPMAVVNVACFHQYINYFTIDSYSGLQTVRLFSKAFKTFLINGDFRAIFFGITCMLQLLALILLTYRNRAKLSIRKPEIIKLIGIWVGVTYMSVPIYVPQYLFGHVDIKMIRFTPVHLAWIVLIVAIILVLYLTFQYKSYESKYLLVLSMSWALMLQFSQMFTATAEINIMKLPLQLCNLGSYLALIMILKKSDKIFHFTLIVNVVGAVIAIVILDISKNASHLSRLWVVHYIVEHTKVLVVPILCLVLRIFKPIEKRSIKHFAIGFTGYYLFVFLLGTISNGFYRMYEGEFIQNFFYANFLFMFDKETAGSLVSFAEPLFEMNVIKIAEVFEIYPVAQFWVYVIFMSVCLLAYVLIHALTKRQRDDYANNRYLKYDYR